MAIRLSKLTENDKMETSVVEQRMDARSELNWPVSIWLPEANRFFNGKSVNISKGGAYLSVPMTTPVSEYAGGGSPHTVAGAARLQVTRALPIPVSS